MFFFAPLQHSIFFMANSIKRLAGQTAIYGVSSIMGRLLNYLLVPIYVYYFKSHEFGIITELYSYVAILLVILTHGMETAFFRFSEQSQLNKDTIFGTSVASVVSLTSLFVVFTLLFSQEIANTIRYPENSEYVVWFAIIIGLDALMAIPFAKLRAENRPIRFAFIKLSGIAVNIILVVLFVVVSPWLLEKSPEGFLGYLLSFYDPAVGVGYVFIANLAASIVTAIMLVPVVSGIKASISFIVWRNLLRYSLPLLVAGLAGIINEALDKILLKYLLPQEIAMSQVGIYGACYKVSVLMILFIQAFRFAADPFFFAEYKKENAKQLYARVMKVFVVTCLFIFLGIMLYMDIIQHFISSEYREGLDVVPILLMSHIFIGIYFNLSIWYKLTGQTHFGAYIAVIGAFITIVLNVIFIPVMGYYASAWVHLVCNFTMAAISWYWGRKRFPVSYDYVRIGAFMAAAWVLFLLHESLPPMHRVAGWIVSAVFLAIFASAVWAIDREARETLRPLLLRFTGKKKS
jgi:O-antigen/teichoic acid export membrane protein